MISLSRYVNLRTHGVQWSLTMTLSASFTFSKAVRFTYCTALLKYSPVVLTWRHIGHRMCAHVPGVRTYFTTHDTVIDFDHRHSQKSTCPTPRAPRSEVIHGSWPRGERYCLLSCIHSYETVKILFLTLPATMIHLPHIFGAPPTGTALSGQSSVSTCIGYRVGRSAGSAAVGCDVTRRTPN